MGEDEPGWITYLCKEERKAMRDVGRHRATAEVMVRNQFSPAMWWNSSPITLWGASGTTANGAQRYLPLPGAPSTDILERGRSARASRNQRETSAGTRCVYIPHRPLKDREIKMLDPACGSCILGCASIFEGMPRPGI